MPDGNLSKKALASSSGSSCPTYRKVFAPVPASFIASVIGICLWANFFSNAGLVSMGTSEVYPLSSHINRSAQVVIKGLSSPDVG